MTFPGRIKRITVSYYDVTLKESKNFLVVRIVDEVKGLAEGLFNVGSVPDKHLKYYADYVSTITLAEKQLYRMDILLENGKTGVKQLAALSTKQAWEVIVYFVRMADRQALLKTGHIQQETHQNRTIIKNIVVSQYSAQGPHAVLITSSNELDEC